MYVIVPTVPAIATRATAPSSFPTRPIVTASIRVTDRAGSRQGVAGATSGAGSIGSPTPGAGSAGSSTGVATGDGTTNSAVTAAAVTSTLEARNMARDPKVS